MKKNIKQLRAISYAICERKKRKQNEYIDAHGLREEFRKSKYKTMTGFLNSKNIKI